MQRQFELPSDVRVAMIVNETARTYQVQQKPEQDHQDDISLATDHE